MSTLITINVTNLSSTPHNFFFFQEPAQYEGGPKIYSNSLYTSVLQPYSSSGAILTFSINMQYYAGAQQQTQPPKVGQSSGQLSASQPIGLTPRDGGPPTNNTTTMSVPSLGLSIPVSTDGPQPGSFRIITPAFNPGAQKYNVGSAVTNSLGGITLSNFVEAPPNQNVDCQPILRFYVAVGDYTPGTVMNFTASSVNSALCDATSGSTVFNVSYNVDGTWSPQPLTLVRRADMTPLLLPASEAVNAQVLNEAGSGQIAVGYADNFSLPMVIQNLNETGAIRLHSEYQVGPIGASPIGAMCVKINGNSATFA